MDEQKKMGLKRKSKPTEKAVDANEDEPIGALLKLNDKINFKKSKVLADAGSDKVKGVVEMASKDVELGGMDDTLAIFRKKVRGSKKNVGSAIAIEKGLSINDVEPPFSSLDGYVKDSELDPNGISRAHKRCLESTNGGSSGDVTAMEGLKSKVEMRNKRSKVKPDTKKIVNSGLDDISELKISMNDALKCEKECALESDGEKLEDSLSVFFQKVQSGISGKFHSSSRLKQGKETKGPGDGLRAGSSSGLESPIGNSKSDLTLVKKSCVPNGNKHEPPSQGSMNSGLICQSLDDCLPEALYCAEEKRTDSNQEISMDVILENSASRHMVEISPTSLRACVVMDIGVRDGKSSPDSIGDQRDSTNKTPDTNNILDRNNEALPCLEPKDLRTSSRDGVENICDDPKLDSSLDADLASKYSAKVQKEDISGDHDGPFKIIDECCKHYESFSTQEMENHAPECKQLAMSDSKSITYEALLQKHKVESNKVDIGPEHVSEHSCAPSEGACPPNSDYPSEDEELNGTNSPNLLEHQGRCAEYRGSITYPETKETSLSLGQRAVRNTRKHRRGDMTYEGDIDWEILMQVPEYIVSHQGSDKAKSKFNSSSTGVHSENGKAAAVSVGLKAHAVGTLEKIKFKEVLKLKGGLQEYLKCRNHVLSVWNKDVTRILHLADFGMSGAPMVGESAHASLIRDIFTFLDQYGYINFGVPSEKEVVEKNIKHEVKLLTEEKFEDNSALPVVDSVDGDSPIPGKGNNLETCMREDDSFAEEILAGKFDTEDGLTNLEALKPSAPPVPAGDSGDDIQGIHSLESTPLEVSNGSKFLDSNHSYKNENGITIPDVQTVLPTPDEAVYGVQTMCYEDRSGILPDTDCSLIQSQHDSGPRKNIIVVGAGPAGLTAARHLQHQGFAVTVIEARNRIGGRVFTDHGSLSVPVDLGASIITGVEADVETERRPDPSSLICAQLGLELTVLNSDCPLYDTVSGQKVPEDLDQELEAEYNGLLDDMELLVAEKGERAIKMSLEEGLEYGLKRRRMTHSGRGDRENTDVDISNAQESKTEKTGPLERRVMDWHFAHLEYGCAALLEDVSLPNWNQDDIYGGFGGAHCMIKGGYSAVVESLAKGICIHLEHVVTDITYLAKDCDTDDKSLKKVKVSTLNGKEFSGDAVLVTVPLGCLKAESIKFSPSLPPWKYLSIKRLGFGVLNKVVLEFPEVFWDDTIDYFGATAEDRDQRGRCFMFWNIKKTVGAPVLIALVVGKAAIDGQDTQSFDNVSHALLVLRKLFGEDKVPDPVASVVTDWGRDPYSYGAYSYVAVGSSGEDYDILGRPVENCVFFAGEATCKEHPDTVGGAMMSGLREAVRIIDIMNTDTDYIAEVEAMEAARRHLDIERSEVKDIIKRLDAVEFSNALYKKSLDGSRISSWCSMLKDMFFSAKTTAGRLRLAKELLNLPVGVLKTFASTKGLSTLNTWILDSMGKDGTQLLRHCVRLLLLISNDLAAVRLSGVGKTVKQKVCIHTSRDIRAIAFQLVRVWVEIFRKEKASKGGLKLLKHPNPLVSGKPPLLKGSLSTKRMVGDPVKSEAHLSNPHCSTGLKKIVEDDTHEIQISEEEKAAFAAAEAASAAAKALAVSDARNNASSQKAPKIVSFHKFAMRGQHTHMGKSDSRKNWSGATIGKQDCLSEIDSRNCRVRDWSVDFSATGVNPETSKTPVDNFIHRSYSNEKIANYQPNIREHSGESAAVDSSILTKAWVDNAGKIGKDYSAIERWQCQAAAAASSGFSYETMHITDEDSNVSSRKHDSRANESSTSQVTNNKGSKGKQSRGKDCLKKAVVNYVASLLMPLYSAKKIERDGYKSIMKKAATKVMDQTRDAEKAMPVSEFLDFKRKNKIRAFVDLLIERHKATKADAKSG